MQRTVHEDIRGSTCVVTGYPGTSLAGSGGAQIGASAIKNDYTYQLANVTLAPSQQAASVIFVYDSVKYSNGGCQPKSSTAMRVPAFPAAK